MMSLFVGILFLACCSVSAVKFRFMQKSVPRHDFVLRKVSDGDQLHTLVFAVKQNNLTLLEEQLMQRSTPGSDLYQQWLTFDEVSALTKNEAGAQEVISWLNASQINITWTSVRQEYITAEAPISLWEELLNTKFFLFEDLSTTSPTTLQGKNVHRATQYFLPEHLTEHISAVFNTVQVPPVIPAKYYHPVRDPNPTSTATSTSSSKKKKTSSLDGTVTIPFLNQLYQITSNTGLASQGQAVFQTLDQSYSPNDLKLFQQRYNLPIQAALHPFGYNTSQCSYEKCGEGNLDTQYIMGISQQTTTIYWHVPYKSGGTDPFLLWATQVANTINPPLVHSISWGAVEQSVSLDTLVAFNTEALKLSIMGVTVTVATGDNGAAANANYCNLRSGSFDYGFWSGFPWFGRGYFPSFPASSPYVTAVGATMGPEKGNPEIACQSQLGGLITSGGGFSTFYPTPYWQQSAVINYFNNLTTSQIPTTGYNPRGRGIPDISLIGVNYQVYIQGQLGGVYGTSASSPVFAGMISLVNAIRASQNKSSLGFLNPTLYSVGTNPITKGLFTDITSGHNKCMVYGTTCCNSGFTATPGWDPVTGLGSITFPNLLAVFTNGTVSLPPTALPTLAPSRKPSNLPTLVPTRSPTITPSNRPTEEPTVLPSVNPTDTPSEGPSVNPTITPTAPTKTPSLVPTLDPTLTPTVVPSIIPTMVPTKQPTEQPSINPSVDPTMAPTLTPTVIPSTVPSVNPTIVPTEVPSVTPSAVPSVDPTMQPTPLPTNIPTATPSLSPTIMPTTDPSMVPTIVPTIMPSIQPTLLPSNTPTLMPTNPTVVPSLAPTIPLLAPTQAPSVNPSTAPSVYPTIDSSVDPSTAPSVNPSVDPSTMPTVDPSVYPSVNPSIHPSVNPSVTPSVNPSANPSVLPSVHPSVNPSADASAAPSFIPSVAPSEAPTADPSTIPSANPSADPSTMPSTYPTLPPSVALTVDPSMDLTMTPSLVPAEAPSDHPTITPSVAPSAKPTADPSFSPRTNPSIAPSVAPTVSPTIAPTAAPSSTTSTAPTISTTPLPSANPSDAPSIAPSVVISADPSVQPTVVPSVSPSIVASVAPSVMLTSPPMVQPSMAPTMQPTILSTRLPSWSPTRKPTSANSVPPPATSSELSFTSSVTLSGVTSAELSIAAQGALILTNAAAMNVSSTAVAYEGASLVSSARERRLVSEITETPPHHLRTANHWHPLAGGSTVVATTRTKLKLTDTSSATTTAVYTLYTSRLLTFIESGEFTSNLRTNAAAAGADELVTVTAANITFSDPQITSVSDPDSSNDSNAPVNTAAIVGLVVGGVLLLLMVVGVFMCLYTQSSVPVRISAGQAATQQNDVPFTTAIVCDTNDSIVNNGATYEVQLAVPETALVNTLVSRSQEEIPYPTAIEVVIGQDNPQHV